MSKRTPGAGIPTPGKFMRVGDSRIRYASMLSALETLYAAKPREYTAIACLMCCYLDAMAARGGTGGRKVLVPFLRRSFKQLCKGLSIPASGKDGADLFYTQFRDEMIHTYFSRDPKYAIAEDWDGNLPWVVMGAGIVFGGVPSVVHYFDPRNGPFVIAFYVSVVVVWILTAYWVFLRGGAEALIPHPGLLNMPSQDPGAVRGLVALMLAGGVAGLTMMLLGYARVPE